MNQLKIGFILEKQNKRNNNSSLLKSLLYQYSETGLPGPQKGPILVVSSLKKEIAQFS
jgi:hypothetical protein